MFVAHPIKARCINGHPLNAETVLWQKLRGPEHRRQSYPICRICRRFSQIDYAARQKASR